MRVFLDENQTSRRLREALISAGHDVEDVLEAGLVGASDAEILAYAASAKRALLTADTHAGEMIETWKELEPPRPLLILVYHDNRLEPGGIARCVSNLESAGLELRDRIEILVRWKPRGDTPG